MITLFFAILFTTLSVALPWREVVVEHGWNEITTKMQGFPWIVAIIVPGVFFLITLTVYIISSYGQRNYFVCITNKRILIRHGCFTNSYKQYSIENVSGNVAISCKQSIFDRRNETACNLHLYIELLPVGHNQLNIYTAALNNGYEFAKQIETTIKQNAKGKKTKTIEE
jgi:hypothetical protein